MKKIFVIEVIGKDESDMEVGLEEAVNRIIDFDFEYSSGTDSGEHEDGTEFGYSYEVHEADGNTLTQDVCLEGIFN